MPQVKVQPIDSPTMGDSTRASDSSKPVLMSRLRRLFDRQFRVSSTDKPIAETQDSTENTAGAEFEPSSVCLAKMVESFIEGSNDKQIGAVHAAKSGRCNCFNGKSSDSSDDEFAVIWNESGGNSSSNVDLYVVIKNLAPCVSMVERKVLEDTANIVEDHGKSFTNKDELRRIVADALSALGYDASICKSAWDKTTSYPAGDYEYIDVVIKAEGAESERLLIDVDFRSEFEIARSTGTYRMILHSLPGIFVGKADRLQQILTAVSEAAKQSLKKKGMVVAPWRRAEYLKAKWLSSYTRCTSHPNDAVSGGKVLLESTENSPEHNSTVDESEAGVSEKILEDSDAEEEGGVMKLIFGDQLSPADDPPPAPAPEKGKVKLLPAASGSAWQPPAVRPRVSGRGRGKVVAGLASLLKDKL